MFKMVLLGGILGCGALAATPFTAPLRSGAWVLLRAAPFEAEPHDLDPGYEPMHKGHISLSTGLYIREDEDLIVHGTPTLVLKRTYRSGFHIQREFGLGTWHNGGRLLEGDADRFSWVEFTDSDASNVRFERISPGTSYANALFEHRSSTSEWQGAQVGWVGSGWAVRRTDGTLLMFQSCGHNDNPHCWILSERDSDGHRITYKRDASGRLLSIEASPERWIAFDYDNKSRITRAYSSDQQEVRYAYDERGRLSLVRDVKGDETAYKYSDRDEMIWIETPEMLIENTFDQAGRVVRQVDSYPNDIDEPYTFDFTYKVVDDAVVEAETRRSDKSWGRYKYAKGFVVEESWGSAGYQPLTYSYGRDPVTNAVTSITLTCPDRRGRSVTHPAVDVSPDSEEWIKWDQVRTVCSWRSDHWAQPK